MHELGIIQEVIEILTEQVKAIETATKVTRVVLEIGKLSGVLPDAIRFSFELCSEGTLVDGAQLEILETSGLALCRVCNSNLQLDQPYGLCDCGSSDFQWLAGTELKIK